MALWSNASGSAGTEAGQPSVRTHFLRRADGRAGRGSLSCCCPSLRPCGEGPRHADERGCSQGKEG